MTTQIHGHSNLEVFRKRFWIDTKLAKLPLESLSHSFRGDQDERDENVIAGDRWSAIPPRVVLRLLHRGASNLTPHQERNFGQDGLESFRGLRVPFDRV